MAKSKLNNTLSRKEHLRKKSIMALEILGEKPHNTTTEKEYKRLCKELIADKLTTKDYTGFMSRIILLARSMGGINGEV
jgi:hypothetical protein